MVKIKRIPSPTIRDTELGWNCNFKFLKDLKILMRDKYREQLSEEDIDLLIHCLVEEGYLIED